MRFRGDSLSEFYGVDSEIGQLRTVLVHRPGAELRRVTPQQKCGLLLPALPWAERAQAEHDAFTAALRSRGVEVLYLTELLQDALEYAPGREQAIATAISDPRLGEELRGLLKRYLGDLRPEELGQVLVMGLARDEFRGGRGAVFSLLGAWDYVIEPLPNLVFARDTCVWIGDRVAVTNPPGRRREAELVAIATGYHPMFAGTKRLYEPDHEVLAGGDVLLLTPGVVAIGVGAHTSPAGMERLARRVFDTGFAHTVLAALTDTGTGEYLDTLCTLIGPDTVMMRPSVAYSLVARTITQRDDGLWLSHPQPFLEAAAQAMGLDRLRVIETGLGPARVGPGQVGLAWRAVRPVGRRGEHPRPRPGHGGVLRAEHAHQRASRGGRHRGDPGAGGRAGGLPRRPARHELPGQQGARDDAGAGQRAAVGGACAQALRRRGRVRRLI